MDSSGSTTPYSSAQQFFEAAALLSLFYPTTVSRIRSRDLRVNGRPDITSWHQALDDLAWLADTDPGGRSTTSLAAVKLHERSVLLLSCNMSVRDGCVAFLRGLLQELKAVHLQNPATQRHTADRLFKDSVDNSYRKVVGYRTRLQKCVKAVLPQLRTTNIQDVNLFEMLTQFQASTEDLAALCRSAYNMRTDTTMIALSENLEGPHHSRWYSIRHLLGRLGAWYKSVKTLVRIGVAHPQLFEGLEIVTLTDRILPYTKPTVDVGAFERAIQSAFPTLHVSRVVDGLQALHGCDGPELRCKYLRILGNPHLKPFIHAEVLLADHIFVNNLSFVRDDRYIGCSKPMCYHCQIYLELHPGNFCSRPCHGNLWLKWSPGALSTNVKCSQTLRERMIGRIHRDAEAVLMGKRSTMRRLPDSTSGLSRSVVV